jgi:hypothetical protein
MFAYRLSESGSGGWYDIIVALGEVLNGKAGIYEALEKCNSKDECGICPTGPMDKFHKCIIQSCKQDDGSNGILVAIVLSPTQLTDQQVINICDSYYSYKGPEWDGIYKFLLEDIEIKTAVDRCKSDDCEYNSFLQEVFSEGDIRRDVPEKLKLNSRNSKIYKSIKSNIIQYCLPIND